MKERPPISAAVALEAAIMGPFVQCPGSLGPTAAGGVCPACGWGAAGIGEAMPEHWTREGYIQDVLSDR